MIPGCGHDLCGNGPCIKYPLGPPHTHGGTDAPECTPYGVECKPPIWTPAEPDFSVMVCKCEDGPYVGAHKAGTPDCCEVCGFMTPAQYNWLKREAWDEGYMKGEIDERLSKACADSGGPVSDCDCQVPSTNPYEE